MKIVYTDDELLNTLRRMSQGEPTLGRRTYENRRSGTDPSAHLFTHRFGSWNRALERAGLTVIRQPLQLQEATPKWSDPQMLAALRDCRREMGTWSVRTYEAWRTDRSHPRLDVPSAISIRTRFGRWSEAIERACA